MLPSREPIFLARETYRRRRLIDAIRLLPVVGLLVFLAPLVGGAGYLRATAASGLFVFAAWLILIVATWVLARLLARAPGAGDPFDPDVAPAQPSALGTEDQMPPGPPAR